MSWRMEQKVCKMRTEGTLPPRCLPAYEQSESLVRVKDSGDGHLWHSPGAFQALCFLCPREVSGSGVLILS